MNPIKHFEVDAAMLRKFFCEDQKTIEHIKGTIYCYPDGQICLESDFETINHIRRKIISEHSGRKEFIDSPSWDDICASLLADKEGEFKYTREEKFETKVVDEPYTGDYILEGVTSEGASISANTSIATKFNDEGIKLEQFGMESDSESQNRGLIALSDLRIDYNSEADSGVIKETRYGLTDIKILKNFEVPFINGQAQLKLNLLPNIDQEGDRNIAKLNSEMMLSNIPITENCIAQENLYDASSQRYRAYFTWFQMLLTFSSGHRVRDIYRVETTQTNNGEIKVVEYWSGTYSLKESGLMLIQYSNISEFIIQVANKVTFDIFGDMGLGLSLSWYIESFNTAIDTEMIPTQCLFLYTAIETLNSNFPEKNLAVASNNSNDLENTSNKKITNIRDNLEKLREFYQEYIVSEETQERKFNSILRRIDQACDSLSTIMQKPKKQTFNTFNDLLKNILIYYKVHYKDLFPDLDIKNVRDKLIHTGFYIKENQEASEFYLKLRSLFIRIVLSILEYEGSYCESAPTAEHGTHQLIYKDFKRLHE